MGLQYISQLTSEIEAEALAELDAWCRDHKLQLASVRRDELLRKRANEEASKNYHKRRFEQTLRAYLDIYKSSLKARDYPKEQPRRKGKGPRKAWLCEHWDRPNWSRGLCRQCAKTKRRRAAGAKERKLLSPEERRAYHTQYMRERRKKERQEKLAKLSPAAAGGFLKRSAAAVGVSLTN